MRTKLRNRDYDERNVEEKERWTSVAEDILEHQKVRP